MQKMQGKMQVQIKKVGNQAYKIHGEKNGK